jgi:uracil-DNA glycosylase family 4
MYADQEYWGRPVPTVGHHDARLLILGLAPAAHGANRTGRMFTGDSSGDWLYEALHRFGFASQPESTAMNDGLELIDCAITASAHCAPPDNKPSRQELDTCRSWLHEELRILRPEVVIVLGRIAWETWWKVLAEQGADLPRPRPGFAHAQWIELEGQPAVLQSYHPSRQNTNTGRLSRPAWHSVFRMARERLA